MWLSEGSLGIDEGPSSRKFVVNLIVNEGRNPAVRSCELIGKGFRNRTSFGADTDVEAVFVKEVAEGLKECLESVGHETKVVSFHDFSIETNGLMLSGAHMMVNCDDSGELHIILRFRYFLGSLQLAFNKNVGFDDGINDENSRLAALVIADLALPILNVCEAAKSGLLGDDPRFTTFGSSLASRAEEISFQIELLKRFVAKPDMATLPANDPGFGLEEPRKVRTS